MLSLPLSFSLSVHHLFLLDLTSTWPTKAVNFMASATILMFLSIHPAIHPSIYLAISIYLTIHVADCSVRFARSLTLSPSRIVIVSFGSSCAPCNRCSKRTDTFTKAQLNLFHVGASIWFFFFSFSTSFPFLISDCCISLLHNLYVCVYIFLMNLTMDLCWLMAPNCGCIFITNVAN